MGAPPLPLGGEKELPCAWPILRFLENEDPGADNGGGEEEEEEGEEKDDGCDLSLVSERRRDFMMGIRLGKEEVADSD